MVFSLFDVNKQLTFYGAYHSNRVNVLIHIFCIPLLLWSGQVIVAQFPVPSFIPRIHHVFNDYLIFDLNITAISSALYLMYYIVLEPVAGLLYAPQMALSVLSSNAFSKQSGHLTQAALLHVASWIAQFLGHGLAEKRAPALLDNIVGAFVLAPFFVHLEILFKLGYNPALHKRINNEIGKEIAKFRKAEGDKKRAAAKEL